MSPASQASPVTQPQRASLDGHQPTISPLSNNPRAGTQAPQQQAHPNHLPSAAQGPAPPPADLNRNVSNASTYAASISTADISEAEAQPLLKGHLVSVRRPPGAPAPNQQAQQWSSNQPQPQAQGQPWPAAAPDAYRNPHQGPGTPVDQGLCGAAALLIIKTGCAWRRGQRQRARVFARLGGQHRLVPQPAGIRCQCHVCGGCDAAAGKQVAAPGAGLFGGLVGGR